MTEPVTQATVVALLEQAGFARYDTARKSRQVPASEGFKVFNHDDGGALVCWIPAAGQDPGNVDALARSYEMAQAYAAAAREAGWRTDRWGSIWHYALIREG